MEQKHCLICSSADIRELKRFSKDFLLKCNACGFIFCKKIPTTTELINHYKTYPRGGEISIITVKRYNELLDVFESYRKTNNILDIGCGNGHFLEVAAKRGWNVYGTEFTDEAIDVCNKKNIKMNQGILNPENYNKIEFDVITSFEVIEHINNPEIEIQNIKKLLRTKGLFYFTTPNFNSISRFILQENWNVIEYPEHLSYYTAKTINCFLNNKGFEKIELKTTGISIRRLQQGSGNMINLNNNPNRDEELREKTESQLLFKIIKNIVNFILNLFQIGDSLKGIYQKR